MKSIFIIAIAVAVIFGASVIPSSDAAIIDDMDENPKQILYIGDNGGECHEIGNWDGVSRTCTFTKDVDKHIFVIGSDLTIDGNGHHVQVTKENHVWVLQNSNTAVITLRANPHNVHLKNLIVEGSSDVFNAKWMNGVGIRIPDSSWNIVVENSEFYNLKTGIICGQGKQASANQIIDNKIHSNQKLGILVNGKCVISENEIYQNKIGIEVSSGFPVTVSNNIIKNNDVGIDLSYVRGMEISDNLIQDNLRLDFYEKKKYPNFKNNSIKILSTQIIEGPNDNYIRPLGSNFWTSFNSESEGCVCSSPSNFCQTSFISDNVIDEKPWRI